MPQSESLDWQEKCRQLRIDPEEVRLVFERYDAYRKFTNQGAGEPISLEQWFRFYYREKMSEGIQGDAVPGACSAQGDAVNNACLKNPADFLRVLTAYDEHGGVPG